MKTKLFIFSLFIIFFCNGIHSQENIHNFLVFTYERYSKTLTKTYWITELDSVVNKHGFPIYINLHPLVIDDASEFNIKHCQNGETINYLGGLEDSSKEHESLLEKLIQIIDNNRILVQTYTIKWNKRPNRRLWVEDNIIKKEKIKVYCTPIRGYFCKCLYLYPYREIKNVYLPISDINYYYGFWDTTYKDIILSANYTFLNYATVDPDGMDMRYYIVVE